MERRHKGSDEIKHRPDEYYLGLDPIFGYKWIDRINFMKHVIKQAGHTEAYDEKKLYNSIYATCLAVNEPLDSAKVIAKKVTKDVEKWLETKAEVTVHDIRAYAGKCLSETDHHAAYLYTHHRIIW